MTLRIPEGSEGATVSSPGGGLSHAKAWEGRRGGRFGLLKGGSSKGGPPEWLRRTCWVRQRGQARRGRGLTEGPAFTPGEAGGPLSREVRQLLELLEAILKPVEFGREREGKDNAKFLA